MPGVGKDLRDILVQFPGLHDKETGLAWLADSSKVSKVRISDSLFRVA